MPVYKLLSFFTARSGLLLGFSRETSANIHTSSHSHANTRTQTHTPVNHGEPTDTCAGANALLHGNASNTRTQPRKATHVQARGLGSCTESTFAAGLLTCACGQLLAVGDDWESSPTVGDEVDGWTQLSVHHWHHCTEETNQSNFTRKAFPRLALSQFCCH